ncbi:MAG: hypothetical protein ABDH20_02055 [Thermus sp.]
MRLIPYLPYLGLAAMSLLGAYLLVGLLGQNPAVWLLFLSPAFRGLFRGEVGVWYGGAVLGLAGAMAWRLGGGYAAMAHLLMSMAADGFLRHEGERGFIPAYLASIAVFYWLLGV